LRNSEQTLQGFPAKQMRDRLGLLARVKNQGQDSTGSARGPRSPGVRAVRRQLDLILASPDFDGARRSREFLRFIVEEALAGRADLLTQAAIATAVFGRREDFDPMVDPIVRIQAGRLRRSLERYYLLSGRHDVLRVDLPKGRYAPTFRVAAPAADEIDSREPLPPGLEAEDGWPVILLGGIEGVGGGPHLQATAARIGDELALELDRYGVVRVLRRGGANGPPPGVLERARFAFSARLEEAGDGLRVAAHLTDRATGQELWGDAYATSPEWGGWSGSSEDVARVIAARIGAEEGVVVQHLASERRKQRTDRPTPYDAFLLSYEAFFARDPQTLGRALEALRSVVKEDPGQGWAWTRLARLCVANYTFEVTSPTTLEEASAFAQQGVRADPSSRSARCVLASILLVKDELAAARAELDHALRSSPDSLVYLDIIGYLLTMLGDWERGRRVLRNAVERNPHHLPHAQFGLWASYLRTGELEEAHRAALDYRDPTYFVRFVMRACCLGLLDRIEEGMVEVDHLLAVRPDFASSGRRLLGHYVKFPEIMDRIVLGLEKVGLTLT
jgi:adenylate cyclase